MRVAVFALLVAACAVTVKNPIDDITVAPPPRPSTRPDVAGLAASPKNEAAALVIRYEADRGALLRAYAVPYSPLRAARMNKFYREWIAAFRTAAEVADTHAGRETLADAYARALADLREVRTGLVEAAALAPLIPFAPTVIELEEARRRIQPPDAVATAGKVDAMRKQVEALKEAVIAGIKAEKFGPHLPASKLAATKAADATDALRGTLKSWHAFYTGYDPDFTWWVAEPYRTAELALAAYADFLRAKAKELPDADKLPEPPDVTFMTLPAMPPDPPDVAALMAEPVSEFVPVLAKYARDRGNPTPWLDALGKVEFAKLSPPGRADYVLFKSHLTREVKRAEVRRNPDRPPVPKDDTGIVGRPIGRAALVVELEGELIPYTPEELIELARTEMAWCEAELKKAAKEMGFGDDWRKAVEKVKAAHRKPGGQPKLVGDLAAEAVAYLKANDLVTVPPLANETWRMAMMSPERQLVSPFFTGGEVVTVAFPTNAMGHDAKLQSLRGNNIHFSKATVQHELIPGHHLQQFSNARHRPYRGLFDSTFWIEGGAVYWEMVLYERGFAATPEDRIGFMVWRTHRCARVIFSLGYHLGTMTPRECIDLLTSKVGFEPENATAEVRRSFAGGYPPLYQAGYLIGAKQFWALRQELVTTGKMTEKAFHDRILAEHSMPVAVTRAILSGEGLIADAPPAWRFGAK